MGPILVFSPIRCVTKGFGAALELARIWFLSAMRSMVSFKILHPAIGLITSSAVGQNPITAMRLIASVAAHMHLEHVERIKGFLVARAIEPMAGKYLLI